jgi:hypothetical protein
MRQNSTQLGDIVYVLLDFVFCLHNLSSIQLICMQCHSTLNKFPKIDSFFHQLILTGSVQQLKKPK